MRSLGAEAVDVVSLGALTVLGLFGLGTAYGGLRYLVAGVVGVLVGSALGWWSARARLPLLMTVAAVLVAFLLFGGPVAVPDTVLLGVLPTPDSILGLASGAVQGWKQLLTSAVPVGQGSNLLVVPFLLGLVASVVQVSIALRTRRPWIAAFVPLVVVAVSILFGTTVPASLYLQGAAVAALTLWWVSHVQRDRRLLDGAAVGHRRWVGGLAMLAVAALIAVLVGSHVPGANSNPRFVLREITEPVPNPLEFPSPLASYRRYTNGTDYGSLTNEAESSGVGLGDEELFEVRGLGPDQRLRLAVMDTYTDGVVFDVGSETNGSGEFRRVAERFSTKASVDEEVEVEVEVLRGETAGYTDVWVPMAELPTSIRFLDASSPDRLDELTTDVRVNATTGTAAVPGGLRAGDRYRFTTVPVDRDEDRWTEMDAAPIDEVPQPYQISELNASEAASENFCDAEVATSAPEGQGDYNQVRRIAANLVRCGGWSDGQGGRRPGHSAFRLREMLATQNDLAGNGEQFAPLAALLSHASGVPARVVMGFRSVEESNERREEWGLQGQDPAAPYRVRGADVTAWIEIKLEGDSSAEWVPIDDVVPVDEAPAPTPPPAPTSPEFDPPPPPPSLPPSEEDLAEASNPCAVPDPDPERCPEPDEPDGPTPIWLTALGVASLPFALLGGVTGLIAGLKARRRSRRRNAAEPTDRVEGGWDEIRDLATDMGSPIPDRTTRYEGARFIGRPEAVELSRRADGLIFGPGVPGDDLVGRYWDEVEATRAAMVSNLGRVGRWKVLISLSSLRADRRRRRQTQTAERRLGASPEPTVAT